MGQNGCRPGDLAVAFWDANPGAMPGEAPKPLAATSPGGGGGGSRAATYPVADSHQARVNDGRTEERGTVIQRINRDDSGWMCGHFFFHLFRIGASAPPDHCAPW